MQIIVLLLSSVQYSIFLVSVGFRRLIMVVFVVRAISCGSIWNVYSIQKDARYTILLAISGKVLSYGKNGEKERKNR